jgi:hypothetical protein
LRIRVAIAPAGAPPLIEQVPGHVQLQRDERLGELAHERPQVGQVSVPLRPVLLDRKMSRRSRSLQHHRHPLLVLQQLRPQLR